MLIIFAERTIKEGKGDDYKQCAKRVGEESRKEKGCIMYELCQSNEDPLKFAMVEKWESQEILDAHFETVHFKEFMLKAGEMTIDRNVKVYSLL